jgi:DNA-binding response OmpR family regulator
MKILVIDDDTMTLEAVKHCLKSDQIEVIVAQSSLEALDAIEKFKNSLGLIICDIMMPGFSGLELLSLLKNFYFNTIPVIVISSLNKADVISSSQGLGAVDFIAKPINFQELSARVKKHIPELAEKK